MPEVQPVPGGATAGTAQSGGGSGFLNALNPAGAIVGIAQGLTSIIGGISQIKEAKKQAEYTRAIGNLSYADQQALNQQMLRATTASERLAILANAVSNVRAAQATQATKNKNTTTILILTGGLVLIIAAFLIKKS